MAPFSVPTMQAISNSVELNESNGGFAKRLGISEFAQRYSIEKLH